MCSTVLWVVEGGGTRIVGSNSGIDWVWCRFNDEQIAGCVCRPAIEGGLVSDDDLFNSNVRAGNAAALSHCWAWHTLFI